MSLFSFWRDTSKSIPKIFNFVRKRYCNIRSKRLMAVGWSVYFGELEGLHFRESLQGIRGPVKHSSFPNRRQGRPHTLWHTHSEATQRSGPSRSAKWDTRDKPVRATGIHAPVVRIWGGYFGVDGRGDTRSMHPCMPSVLVTTSSVVAKLATAGTTGGRTVWTLKRLNHIRSKKNKSRPMRIVMLKGFRFYYPVSHEDSSRATLHSLTFWRHKCKWGFSLVVKSGPFEYCRFKLF